MVILTCFISIIILTFIFINYICIYGEWYYDYYYFSYKLKNYKVKKIIYKDKTVRFQPWAKLKYKPWRWKQLAKFNEYGHLSYKYEFKTFDEAEEICKIFIAANKKHVKEKTIDIKLINNEK